MKLLICMITYNRLKSTQKTLHSLWRNTSDGADYFLVIADNASTDGTKEYLKGIYYRGRIDKIILNPKNYYPGKACNRGWKEGLRHYNPTHLMRLDNDMQFSKNWDLRVAQYFKAIPELGQLGIEHEAIETPEADLKKRTINGFTINEWPGCVGGPMVMPWKLWNLGIRYDQTPWHKFQKGVPAMQEDSKLSHAVKEKGFLVGHAQEELARTFATRESWKEDPEYYRKTMEQRGYDYLLEEIK